MRVGLTPWREALDAVLEERDKVCTRTQAKATTWRPGEEDTPSWQSLELGEKFLSNATADDESKGLGVVAAHAIMRDGGDQIPVFVIALDLELGDVPMAPPISGAPEGDTPLTVGEYNARGRIAGIYSWNISLPP